MYIDGAKEVNNMGSKRLWSFLYEERLRRNLTQEQISKEIGISFLTYNYLEKGINKSISFKTVAKLANYFEMTPAEIREML